MKYYGFTDHNIKIDDIRFYEKILYKTDISEKDALSIKTMIDNLEKYSIEELIAITKNQDPWREAYNNENKIITNKSIHKYFMS